MKDCRLLTMKNNRLIPSQKELFKRIPKHTSHKRLAKIFQTATEFKNGAIILHIIRNFPFFHSYNRHGCGLINGVIANYWPEFYESIFKAGFHPDSDCCFLAFNSEYPKLCQLAIQYGANPSLLTNDGEHALGFATAGNSLKTIKILLDSGADVNQLECYYEYMHYSTALDCANKSEVYCYLRSRGAKHLGEIDPELYEKQFSQKFVLEDRSQKAYSE